MKSLHGDSTSLTPFSCLHWPSCTRLFFVWWKDRILTSGSSRLGLYCCTFMQTGATKSPPLSVGETHKSAPMNVTKTEIQKWTAFVKTRRNCTIPTKFEVEVRCSSDSLQSRIHVSRAAGVNEQRGDHANTSQQQESDNHTQTHHSTGKASNNLSVDTFHAYAKMVNHN